ncbi:hypothetical protein V2G26_014505 [Clonostachys chloroleuca]
MAQDGGTLVPLSDSLRLSDYALIIIVELAHYQQPSRLTSGWRSTTGQRHTLSDITESGPSSIVPTLLQAHVEPRRKPLPEHGSILYPLVMAQGDLVCTATT